MPQPDYDLVVIGGGAAGLTAGLYAARARLNTLLLEMLSPGGQILTTDWVENYPGFPEGVSGFDLVDKMRDQAERFGLKIQNEEVTSLDRDGATLLINTTAGQISSKTITLTTGAKPNKLGIPGEEEMTGKGVSYCGTCDGPFFRDVPVAVLGGGDTAVEEALVLTRFASKVNLFHRRDELRATGILRERILEEEKVEIYWSTIGKAVVSNEAGQVSALSYEEIKTGQTRELPVEGVFIFVGTSPMTEAFKGFVDMDEKGFVVTNLELETSQPGVWAAGDNRIKNLRQIVTAAGDGATAAFNTEKYIREVYDQS